jgi:hypothetical protein
MFAPNSRYANCTTYTVTLPNGQTVLAVTPPAPALLPLAGYHQRASGDRLDIVATRYFNAPTTFWRLCDANNALVPGALATRALIGIPQGGST